MKVESNWTKTRYSFICEDEKDKKFLDKMNKYIDGLEEENKKLKEERDSWKEYQHRSQSADGEQIERLLGEKIKLEEENKKLKEKIRFLEQCLDKLMFAADIVNVKIHGELGDYVYVRSDKQFKLNVKE